MIYNAFTDWLTEFMKRIADFFQGNSPVFAIYERIIVAILLILVGWGLACLYEFILRKTLKVNKKMVALETREQEKAAAKGKKRKDKTRAIVNAEITAKQFVIPLVKIIHWIIVSIIVLAILGVNLASTAGVLSAITVAMGLALQDIIGCFAAGLIVLATKPLSVGEYVMIKNAYGEAQGTVIKVGVMMTELSTFDGHYVYIPNSNIQKSIITNVNRDPDRRIDINIQVAYNSDIDLVKKVMTEVGNSDKRVMKGRGVNVYLTEFKDSGLTFSLRVWTKDTDYWETKFLLNERVIRAFRENNIEIPYNTITISNNDKN